MESHYKFNKNIRTYHIPKKRKRFASHNRRRRIKCFRYTYFKHFYTSLKYNPRTKQPKWNSHFFRLSPTDVIIFIHKPNKPKSEASSYRSISLLLVLANVFEKKLIKWIRSITRGQNLIFNTQLGFRSKHSTTQ